ncbi:MAG TPA: Gfo/Idh/MocA family oxidoreductase [Chitinophagaceae bacterium]|jgi:predicted dehydrogenase|nr:Gfo/Idh/MocA family oxidoreductase [Chitinophagaceae bacterium]
MISWGIIGCGDVTEVKSGPAFNKVPDSRLVAVMRRNGKKAADYARRHGVPRWYTEASDLIHDKEVTAVYIATPPRFHEEYAVAALEAGKPVYLEKPMTLDAAGARRVQDAVERTGLPLVVAHYRRAQPLFRKIKECLDQQMLGTLQGVHLRLWQPHRTDLIARTEEPWRTDPALSGGGLFHDLAPHQLDLLRFYFGEATGISGLSGNRGGHYGADDFVTGYFQLAGGLPFTGSWCFSAPAETAIDECMILGSTGSLRFSFFGQPVLYLTRNGNTEVMEFERLAHVQQPMIAATVQHFLGNGPNPCPVTEGVAVMEQMEAMTGVKRL